MSQYPIGGTKDELDTPCLCVDLDVMEENIRRMASYCREHGVAWRPHCKCHKVPAIAHMQLAAGAVGVTCAKLGEAEVMAAGGVRDLLVANQIAGQRKVERLVSLCRIADVICTVDHLDQAKPIAQAAKAAGVAPRVIIEVDIGLNRAGTRPGGATVELAEQITRLAPLRFAGLMAYEGHLLTIRDPKEKRKRIADAIKLVVDTKKEVEQAGIPCELVSCGGTGSFHVTAKLPGVTEIQAGGGIFMDPYYREHCYVSGLDFALTVLATVTGRPTPGRANIDAGWKTTNPALCLPLVAGRDDIKVKFLSAEHGTLTLQRSARDLAIGDRLELVVGYGDFTTCLHDELYAFRGERLEAVWPILARGKIR